MSEVTDSTMIGVSARLTFWKVGLLLRLAGRSARAALMAACTSRAAPFRSRSSTNCRLISALPSELVEVIWVTPAIEPRCRSSGLVTLVETVAGLAPGRLANTEMVGKSTRGSGETGSLTKANRPDSAMPSASRVVATGRRMKKREKFMRAWIQRGARGGKRFDRRDARRRRRARAPAGRGRPRRHDARLPARHGRSRRQRRRPRAWPRRPSGRSRPRSGATGAGHTWRADASRPPGNVVCA
ncbi:hypothetical protein BUGL105410_23190 [Burkholderia gladioli]